MRLFSSDIDGTVYDEQDPGCGDFFRAFWDGAAAVPLGARLSYNTGRSLKETRDLICGSNLPEPDFLICAVGTVIYDWRRGQVLSGYSDSLGENWDRGHVVETFNALQLTSDAEPQPELSQGAHKASWFWDGASEQDVADLVDAIEGDDVEVQAVYSSRRDLDILPRGANKGNAIRWLAHQLGLAPHDVVVAGDSGNDLAMFLVPGVRGIVPDNAEPALVKALDRLKVPYLRAGRPCAYGVVDSLTKLLEEAAPAG